MKPTISRAFPRQLATGAAALLVLGCTLAQAQQVYRIVGADGTVTFSDQPPAAAAKPSSVSSGSSNSANAGSGRLPFTLAKVAGQFPVVLYTGKECAPCNSGRNMLVSRGIPFTEKTVDNSESVAALKQLSSQSALPLLTIGTQQLKGYSDTTWTQYLDAAGYPEKSALPSSYQRAGASPLAEAKTATPSTTNAATDKVKIIEKAEPETTVSPSSGIRF